MVKTRKSELQMGIKGQVQKVNNSLCFLWREVIATDAEKELDEARI